jgi:hypothetical protein
LKEKESTPDSLSFYYIAIVCTVVIVVDDDDEKTFALLSILERIQSSINNKKRCSFDEIARANPSLRNKSSTSKYLKLMQALGLAKVEMVNRKFSRNPRRSRSRMAQGEGRGGGRRTLKKLYALTEKG